MHFCQQCKHHPEPLLYLNNKPIQILKETKFLGILFDSKLTFIPHIKYLNSFPAVGPKTGPPNRLIVTRTARKQAR